MVAETDIFIVATFALWAGDFSYCEELLHGFSPSYEILPITEGVQVPEDFIRLTGALRLRQLWQKREEFKKLTEEHENRNRALTDKTVTIETNHLRATVWRTGERNFQMQGYLKDLSWQESLFDRARRKAGMVDRPKDKTILQEPERLRPEVVKSLGSSWVVTGNPFLQVELTDMGLIEANGLWIEPHLPESVEVIIGPFYKLLKSLDEPEPVVQTVT